MKQATRTNTLIAATLLAACAAHPPSPPSAPAQQVLFVCEHGNVKSLMAASYFNQLATERALPFRAITRGVAPNATSAPPAIVAGLRAEGIDVGEFRPAALSAADASASHHVVAIGADLPASAAPTGAHLERWNDVPSATAHYAAARASLRAHVKDLIDRLSAVPSRSTDRIHE